jgi:hypothetical protein
VRRLTSAKLAAIAVLMGALIWYAFQVLQPSLPVTVRFRSDARGAGFALIFLNESDQTLAFTATLEHPGRQQAKTFALQLQPRGSDELGSSQGWVGQSGDHISLTAPHYRAWTGGIP